MNFQTNLLFIFLLLIQGCASTENNSKDKESKSISYFDNSGRDDVLTGGVKMIEIETPSGKFNVWTKRVGNNPDIKVLLLHGGPGANHIYFKAMDSYFPGAGIEYYYYDQLGSQNSDQPEDTSLWHTTRFVEEVEQVRKALHLNKDNFYLLGHSWGGILAIEYALKYQQNLKGLIISNMMASIPAYVEYAENVLGPQLDPEVLKEIKAFEAAKDYANPHYLELIETHYYPEHVLRMPLKDWPEPVNRSFKTLNPQVYVLMQGPSEFGVAGDARLKNWDRSNDLNKITVPTLTVGAEYDTMDPKYMDWMSTQFKNGSFLYCPNGSHMAMYDDQVVYMNGVIEFVKGVDQGKR
jgi:proline iminopeptidase